MTILEIAAWVIVITMGLPLAMGVLIFAFSLIGVVLDKIRFRKRYKKDSEWEKL